jgi:hypothetical protein
MAIAVAPGAHAVLPFDEAGWHLSDRLIVPVNIKLMLLPAKRPELNPVENVWQIHARQLAAQPRLRIEREIVDHCCHAWNKLIDQPWHITSIGLRDGPMGSNQRALVLRRSMPTEVPAERAN